MSVGLIWAQSTSGVIGRDGGMNNLLPVDERPSFNGQSEGAVGGQRRWAEGQPQLVLIGRDDAPAQGESRRGVR